VSDVRTKPLTRDEVRQYRNDGYLFPIRVLSDDQVVELRKALEDHLFGRIESPKYELTDPIRIRRVIGRSGQVNFEYEDGQTSEEPHTFPFFFNLWKSDGRFEKIGKDPVIAGMARQLLGAEEVLLMEDNAVVKAPHSTTLPWHQDYSYWPLAEPAAITVWIALDHITIANGAMQVVPRSHRLGERLPVSFGDARAFMHEERPGVEEVPQDPAACGHAVVTYDLKPGECGFHSALLWHASTPNTHSHLRCAFILRYLAAGTIWLGAARFPYDDVGCAIGAPISGVHFPSVATAF
jgi:hypothetical protein